MGRWVVDIFRYIPLSVLAVVVAAAIAGATGAAIPGLRAHDRAGAATSAARVLLAGAVIAVLAVTLAASGGPGGANLNGAIGALNLLGNVMMFVPFGLLAPTALGWGGRRVVAADVDVNPSEPQMPRARTREGGIVGRWLCRNVVF